MTPAARHAAAIDVLTEIFTRHRPASEALNDWGKAHRFAGSGDRHAIGTIVYDVLRQRASLAWRIGADTPRALVLALIAFETGTAEKAASFFSGEKFAPAALSAEEADAIARPRRLEEADAPVRGDYPAWLDPSLAAVFGEGRAQVGAAMARRAPVDLRVNTLKTDRARMLAALGQYGAVPGTLVPTAIRIPAPGEGRRSPHIESDPAYQKGLIEIQDEGSQLVALLAGARPGEQVADLCAGGGGKTLALAAMMENRGQLYAWDKDRHRLAPIHQRLERAGVRNVQVLPAADESALKLLDRKLDRVVLDVPCSGTGTWRRKPDAKWRFKPSALAARQVEQDQILALGASLLKTGGELVYITCSLLPEENEDRIAAFLASPAGEMFERVDLEARWRASLGPSPACASRDGAVRINTLEAGTDAFFIACLKKRNEKSFF